MNRNILRSSLMVLVAGALALGISACLPVPLGDPEKAKSDPKFIGAWEWKEEGVMKVAVIRAWDERSYVIDVMGWTGTADAPRPKERNVYKAWLADVKGHTFMSLQPMETLSVLPGQKRETVFLVCKLSLAGETLTVTPLDGEFAKFKDVGTSTVLEKVVAENLDDVKMWSKPMEMTKMGAGRAEELDRILKAFTQSAE